MSKLASPIPSMKTGRMRKGDRSKNGGARRSPKALDPEVEHWSATAKTAFPAAQSSMIPMLQSAQANFGYLSRDAMEAIARHLVVPTAQVEGVASFYAQFRFEKPGRHRVTVCRGTACYVRGSGKLMNDLQRDLKVTPGGTTADGNITLEAVSCFGACALAPVVVVDGTVNGRVNATSLKTLVDNADKPAGDVKSEA
jgi:NADH:ubiquinone oxidoreductase subunit E